MKKRSLQSEESANTVVLTLVTLVVLAGFVGFAVDYTGNIARNGSRDRLFNTAVEIGDGCISEAFSAWRQICKTQSDAGVQNPPTTTFSSIPTPTPGNFPSYPGVVITNYKVQAVDPLCTLSTVNPPVSALDTSTGPPQTTGPGTGTFSYFYLASADVTLPAVTGTLTAKVRRIFEKRYTSPWNWAMMYSNTLELHPASNFTLNGWVHSNQDVYAGSDGTNYLTLTDRLTYQGNYTVGFAPNDTAHVGPAATPTYPSDLPPGHEQYYALFGWDETQFNTTDTNPNNDSYREMIMRPDGINSDPFAAQRLYNQAAIVVTIDTSNTMKVFQGAYTSRSDVTGQTNNGAGGTAAQAAAASISPNHTIQDGREQNPVRLVDFDVATFLTYYPSSTTKSWNGIIYIVDTSASSSLHRGVRIKNAAKLPTGGMTIVSENPVYIQGDFNTGKTSTAQPPSNTGDPTDPDVSGYTRRPSSVMGDAITLLSNNWNDANSGAGLASRVASNTTVNAALVSGNVPTGTSGSVYSGGGENFVRFLEDWTGKTFTYYGSMLNLYASAQGIGAWGAGNYYLPPAQYWYFDSSLSVDSAGNPVTVPGYISTVAYLQQQRWYLQY